jgi:hypothetical protein
MVVGSYTDVLLLWPYSPSMGIGRTSSFLILFTVGSTSLGEDTQGNTNTA